LLLLPTSVSLPAAAAMLAFIRWGGLCTLAVRAQVQSSDAQTHSVGGAVLLAATFFYRFEYGSSSSSSIMAHTRCVAQLTDKAAMLPFIR
jgi:hypothetical protein